MYKQASTTQVALIALAYVLTCICLTSLLLGSNSVSIVTFFLAIGAVFAESFSATRRSYVSGASWAKRVR